MTPEEINQFRTDQQQSLLDRGEIILTVELKTLKDAEQILEWMYASDKPMTSELLQISWNSQPVTNEVKEAIDNLKIALDT